MRTRANRVVDAVFEDGAFKPLGDAADIPEHTRGRVLICNSDRVSERSKFCGTLTLEEAKEELRVIDDEFGRVEGDW